MGQSLVMVAVEEEAMMLKRRRRKRSCVKEMMVVRVLFGLFCILSLIHAVRIEAQTLSEVEREHPDSV